MATDFQYIQPINPTDDERYEMLKLSLKKANRLEDFDNIVELFSPPADITTIISPTQCTGLKVGIIGGGLAGLSAAFELRKLGFDITIFEMQEKRIGGRVYTHYFDKDKELYGELGAMRIPISHETIWHYIKLFGLKTRPFIQTNENAFMYLRNKRVRNDSEGKNVMEKIYPEFNLTPWERNTSWQKLLNYGLGTPLLKMYPSIRKEILQVKKKYSRPIQYWTGLSIRQVLEIMGLSQAAIDLLGSVSPLAGSFYYNSYLENLQEDYPINFTFMYEIVGGLVNLPLALYHSLMSKTPKEYPNIKDDVLGKVVWNNGKRVSRIYKSGTNNRVILEYKGKKNSETYNETFDFVVCAIPFSSLRNVDIYPMFSVEKMQAIKEVGYSSAQKTIFMCNKRFWEKGNDKEKIVGGGSYTDLPISSIWYPSDHGNINSKRIEKKDVYNKNKTQDLYEKPGVLIASYNFTQDALRLGNLDNKIRFEHIKRQVEAVHGTPKGYLDSIVEESKTIQWDNENGFNGAFSYFMPEQKSIFSYAAVKPEYKNTVYFAGEHTSVTHAWLQGAVNSGMEAANAIAEYCKTHIKE